MYRIQVCHNRYRYETFEKAIRAGYTQYENMFYF